MRTEVFYNSRSPSIAVPTHSTIGCRRISLGESRLRKYGHTLIGAKPLGALSTSRRIAFHDFTQAQQSAAQARIQLAQKVKDAYYTLMAAQDQVRTSESN